MGRRSRTRAVLVLVVLVSALLPGPAVGVVPFPLPAPTASFDPSLPRPTVRPCAPVVLYDRPCRVTVLGPPGAPYTFSTAPTDQRVWLAQETRPSTLDGTGRADFTLSPLSHNTAMHASLPGGPPSEVRTVRVKRRVTLDVSLVRPGVYRFSGRNEPGQTPLSITLARVLPGGRLLGVAATSPGGDLYSYAVDLRLRPGTWFFTVLTGPTNRFFVQGNSRIYGLVVPPA